MDIALIPSFNLPAFINYLGTLVDCMEGVLLVVQDLIENIL